MEKAVEMIGITKTFPGVVANHAVDFWIEKGTVHGLLGENGAGKTTLMNVLYGLYQQDAGEIRIAGKRVTIGSPRDALELGIGMVHQHFQFVPRMTVADNFVLGMHSPREPLLEDRRTIHARIRRFSEQYQLPVDPARPMWQLAVGEQQRVEILRALYRGADVLILDEPTSVLTPQEVTQLGSILENLVQMDKSVILITHKLDEVMSMTHRVTVMRDAEVVGVRETFNTSPDELVRMMVGRDLGSPLPKVAGTTARAAMQVQSLHVRDDRGLPVLKDLSFEIQEGEILGIAGVDGNGQVELEETLVGLRPVESGQVFLAGREVTHLPAVARRRLGLAYTPSDRYLRGLVKGFSVSENLILGQHWIRPYSNRGVFAQSAVVQHAKELVNEYRIHTPGIDTPAGSLSGGNAQRLIMARELSSDPRVILACQPTRGLDVGATEYVRNQLLRQRNGGAAVLLISADLEEIMILSDRISVLFEGEIVGTLSSDKAEVELLGHMMAGSRPDMPSAPVGQPDPDQEAGDASA